MRSSFKQDVTTAIEPATSFIFFQVYAGKEACIDR